LKKSTGLLLCGVCALGLAGFANKTSAAEVEKNGQTYWQVEPNDTLSAIGLHYGIDYYNIAAVNSQIKDVDLIFDGDLLLIPINGETIPVVEQEVSAEEVYVEEETYVPQEQVVEKEVATPSYSAPSGGHLTASGGVFYGPSGKETYYSQKVLPGGGLNIPGRHVAGDGTIRDVNGYIVLASDVLSKGSITETSLGTGKVYDCGVGHPGVDIYTNW